MNEPCLDVSGEGGAKEGRNELLCSLGLRLWQAQVRPAVQCVYGGELTVKHSHLQPEREMLVTGPDSMMVLGYQTLAPSHRFRTQVCREISSTLHMQAMPGQASCTLCAALLSRSLQERQQSSICWTLAVQREDTGMDHFSLALCKAGCTVTADLCTVRQGSHSAGLDRS